MGAGEASPPGRRAEEARPLHANVRGASASAAKGPAQPPSDNAVSFNARIDHRDSQAQPARRRGLSRTRDRSCLTRLPVTLSCTPARCHRAATHQTMLQLIEQNGKWLITESLDDFQKINAVVVTSCQHHAPKECTLTTGGAPLCQRIVVLRRSSHHLGALPGSCVHFRCNGGLSRSPQNG